RALEQLRRADLLVDPRQGQDPIVVGLEASLGAEVLENPAGAVPVPRHLRDPGLRQDGQLVEVRILARVLARELAGALLRLFGAPRQEETEHFLELQVRGGFLPELVRADDDETRVALFLARQLQERGEPHERRLARMRPGVDPRPAADGRGQLAAYVLDLGEQVESGETLGLLL